MNEHPSKIAIAERLMVRRQGATMDEILAATGGSYQYNALRRLEARGYSIATKREGRTKRYFATPPATRSAEASVTRKWQVTIPKEMREHLRVSPGQTLRFAAENDSRVVVTSAYKGLSELVGVLPKAKRVVSLREMDEAIAKSVVSRYLRAVGKKR
jgi:AbrB family looped-hinge helix DNA binding protein